MWRYDPWTPRCGTSPGFLKAWTVDRIELERVRQPACLARVEFLADVDPEELALGRLRFERIVERERLIVPVGIELPHPDTPLLRCPGGRFLGGRHDRERYTALPAAELQSQADGEHPPGPGHALQLVLASLVEFEPRTHHKIPYRA